MNGFCHTFRAGKSVCLPILTKFFGESLTMRIAFFFGFFLLVAFASSRAQSAMAMSTEDLQLIQEYEDTLGVLSFAILRDTSPAYRFASCKQLIPTLVKALKLPNSFSYPFPQLDGISIQYPADSSFRIFTWQLFVSDDDYRYYGAIQMNASQLELFPLIDRSQLVDQPESAILTNDHWYGALYYRIKDFEDDQGKGYLLFGLDAWSFFRRRKVVDVLRFIQGKPVFGQKVFESRLTPDSSLWRHRLVVEYGAQASVHVNYDEGRQQVFMDHLIPFEGPEQAGSVMVPDGSYEGYRFEEGRWVHIPKLFNQTQTEPPREMPVLEEKKNKDLFGRPRKD